jgi:hypothetical protein
MPYLEDRDLRRLARRGDRADYELDLTGVDREHARLAIERMLERQRFRDEPRSVVIRLDPAGPDSGETLFQPVGRQLLAAMKRGLVARCAPIPPEAGAGFTVDLPGRAAAEEGSV